MTVLALVILALFFCCSVSNETLGLSIANKTHIACAQLRASNCSHFVRWDLRCEQEVLTVAATSKVMRPGYRLLKAGRVTLSIKIHITRLSWDAALRVCQSEGGSLLKIDTDEKEVMIKENMMIKRRSGKPDFLWLGLRYITETNTYLWTDNTPIEHTPHWGPGEPSHIYFYGTVVREDCVGLASDILLGTYWNDLPCEGKYGFICEVQ